MFTLVGTGEERPTSSMSSFGGNISLTIFAIIGFEFLKLARFCLGRNRMLVNYVMKREEAELTKRDEAQRDMTKHDEK